MKQLSLIYSGLVAALALAGCNGVPAIKVQLGAGDTSVTYASLVAADEPQAALEAREVLEAGGNAVDAAVTLGFTLAVTFPSSAGLGGSGACIVHDSVSGTTEALDFTARASSDPDAARYRAAIPALSRALFALHAKYGQLPWPQVVTPAENLARFGQSVSRAFAKDLAAGGSALMNDRTALDAFMTPKRQMLQAGDGWKQFDLAITLSRLRARGPGDFYSGGLGREVEDAIAAAGGTITAEDLRAYVPRWIQVAGVDEGGTRLFALPEGYGGGHFMAVYKDPAPATPATPGALPTPGSTGFVVADKNGGAVACTLTMGRAFGLGIMPKTTGFLLAPAPDGPRLESNGAGGHGLAPVLGVNIAKNRIVFAAAAAGEGAVHEAVTLTKRIVVEHRAPMQAMESTKAGVRATLVNMLSCRSQGEAPPVCEALSDRRGDGYAITQSSGK